MRVVREGPEGGRRVVGVTNVRIAHAVAIGLLMLASPAWASYPYPNPDFSEKFGRVGTMPAHSPDMCPELGDHYGYTVTMVGDINGDGPDDWAVAAPYNIESSGMIPDPNDPLGLTWSPPGTVYLYSGAPGSPLLARFYLPGGVAVPNPGGCSEGGFLPMAGTLGVGIAGVGDLDSPRDGRNDFLISAPALNAGAQSGVVYMVHGNPGITAGVLVDLTNSPMVTAIYGLAQPGDSPSGSAHADNAGVSLAAFDYNWDGVRDIVIGAPGVGIDDAAPSGTVYIRTNSPTPACVTDFDVKFEFRPSGCNPCVEHLGGFVEAGLFGGTFGRPTKDLIIGAAGNGEAFLVVAPPASGPPVNLADPSIIGWQVASVNRLVGVTAALNVGDENGDGYEEMLLATGADVHLVSGRAVWPLGDLSPASLRTVTFHQASSASCQGVDLPGPFSRMARLQSSTGNIDHFVLQGTLYWGGLIYEFYPETANWTQQDIDLTYWTNSGWPPSPPIISYGARVTWTGGGDVPGGTAGPGIMWPGTDLLGREYTANPGVLGGDRGLLSFGATTLDIASSGSGVWLQKDVSTCGWNDRPPRKQLAYVPTYSGYSTGNGLYGSNAPIYVGEAKLRNLAAGVIDFDTNQMVPQSAIITKATLTWSFTAAGTPSSLGSIVVDQNQGFLGSVISVENADFDAFASNPSVATVAWNATSATVQPGAINRTGPTQFRFAFDGGFWGTPNVIDRIVITNAKLTLEYH